MLQDVEYFQFMAKDNVPFHSVMFPSAQLGSGEDYTIVNHIMATGNINGTPSMGKINQFFL
jgi:methionyl-tRNA synthetase